MLQWMKHQSKRRRLLLSEQLGVQESDQLYKILGTQDERNQLHFERTFSSSARSIASFLPQNLLQLGSPPSLGYSSSHNRLVALQSNLNDATTSPPTGLANQEHLNSSPLRYTFLDEITASKNNNRIPIIQQRLKSGNESTASNQLDENDNDNPKFEYKGSSTFLKGTQSANPHNDYCQHYVDTGQRPQNFIRDYELHDRFEEYPKLKELIKLKDELIAQTATPPMYLKCDLKQSGQLRQLDCKFDVILIDPPLEEYQRTQGVTKTKFWSWESLMHLEIEEVAAPRSFIFLWCGSSDGLDLGRQCLRKWGFRRCEDICWIKTNKNNIGHNKNLEPKAIFQRTKEHCLMGIKGTVRRSTDGDFIHSNVDIDLIISEESRYGRRRLHLFGRDSTIRPGWLTVGPDLTNSNFNPDLYKEYFSRSATDYLTGCTVRIETLRPKSPPPKAVPLNTGVTPMLHRKRY